MSPRPSCHPKGGHPPPIPERFPVPERFPSGSRNRDHGEGEYPLTETEGGRSREGQPLPPPSHF